MKLRLTALALAGIYLAGCANVQALKPTDYKPVPESEFIPYPIPSLAPIIPLIRNIHRDITITKDTSVSPIFIKLPIKPAPIVVVLPTSATKAYAYRIVGAVQYGCLDNIFTRESHWNPLDVNKSSGAYGIPQALPGSKMASFGADWRTNPITQVRWGLHYMNSRYGSPCQAWTFWQVHHWY